MNRTILWNRFHHPDGVGIHEKLNLLLEGLLILMADQDKLDADVAALTAATTAVSTNIAALNDEITALKNQPAAAALNFDGLDAAVAAVAGLVPPATS